MSAVVLDAPDSGKYLYECRRHYAPLDATVLRGVVKTVLA